VSGLTVGILTPDGSHVTLRGGDELELVLRSADASRRRTVTPDEVPGLLETRFGLPGFRVDADGRVGPAQSRLLG
jgi:hypothetical protein